jgi:hypothetical protein
MVSSSSGKYPMREPYSEHMLAMADRSATDSRRTPGPKNSTKTSPLKF